ncbi:hypothetical protein RvY_02286 [Ramazzottius varieornatus]|uniref:GH18 domain-containing protein n=1 Tax=Ramazzottius varieornatus TaxID=947166 RepID=A0A1D1UMY7_RAMVA|nr:hypothetical protein RvY_02286 [Ramazzottius varieornatus]
MATTLLLITVVSFIASVVVLDKPVFSAEPKFILPHRGCYYASWSTFRPGKARFLPRHIDGSLCTIFYYAFAEIKLDASGGFDTNVIKPSFGFLTRAGASPYSNVSLSNLDSASDLKFLKRKNPDIKLMLSVGGWGTEQKFTAIAQSADLRKIFISTVIKSVRQLEYDGLDISWEYPLKKDAAYFTSLITDIRTAFDNEATSSGQTRLIFTAAVGNSTLEGYNVPLMNQSLDLINLMTYDLHTPYFEPTETGHHSQLFPPFSNSSSTNVRDFTEAWEKAGIHKSKLVVGLAAHGDTWNLTTNATGVGAKASGQGPPGFFTKTPGFLAYFEICEKIRSAELIPTLQPDIKTPYARSSNGQWWVSYEDETSVREKVRWTAQKRYSGVFLWDITLDDFFGGCGVRYPLLNAVKSEYKV